MIYKGTIIKVEKNYVVVLANSMQYLKIYKKDGLKIGKEILFVKDDIYKDRYSQIKQLCRYAAVFLILLISVTTFINLEGFNNVTNAAALISIDINPSIELEIDHNNKIIKYNSVDMTNIGIDEKEILNQTTENAILAVLKAARKNDYLTADKSLILIAMVNLDEDFEMDISNLVTSVNKKLTGDEDFKNLKIYYISGEINNIAKARRYGVSIGKYEFYNLVKSRVRNINLHEFNLSEIQNYIDKDVNPPENFEIEEKKNQLRNRFMNRNKQRESEDNSSTPKENIMENGIENINAGQQTMINIREELRNECNAQQENCNQNINNNYTENPTDKKTNLMDENKGENVNNGNTDNNIIDEKIENNHLINRKGTDKSEKSNRNSGDSRKGRK